MATSEETAGRRRRADHPHRVARPSSHASARIAAPPSRRQRMRAAVLRYLAVWAAVAALALLAQAIAPASP